MVAPRPCSCPIRCFLEERVAVLTPENSLWPGHSHCGLAIASLAWPQPLWPGHSLCGLATAPVAWPQPLGIPEGPVGIPEAPGPVLRAPRPVSQGRGQIPGSGPEIRFPGNFPPGLRGALGGHFPPSGGPWAPFWAPGAPGALWALLRWSSSAAVYTDPPAAAG